MLTVVRRVVTAGGQDPPTGRGPKAAFQGAEMFCVYSFVHSVRHLGRVLYHWDDRHVPPRPVLKIKKIIATSGVWSLLQN
jgi:hypothetical protein